MSEINAPGTRYLATGTATVAAPVTIAEYEGFQRRMVPITGGDVTGRIEGRMLGGADWQYVYDSGVSDLEAHYCLELKGGAVVEVKSSGIRSGDPAVLEKLMTGEPVADDAYYFRTAIKFHTSASEYLWLTKILCIGTARRNKDRVEITLFEVL